MIQLKKHFRKYGADFNQLYKDEEIVIYRTTLPSVEVFRYKVRKPDKFFDDSYELYPSESSFGDWAWCCTSRKQFERVLKTHFRLTPEKYEICQKVWPI